MPKSILKYTCHISVCIGVCLPWVVSINITCYLYQGEMHPARCCYRKTEDRDNLMKAKDALELLTQVCVWGAGGKLCEWV